MLCICWKFKKIFRIMITFFLIMAIAFNKRRKYILFGISWIYSAGFSLEDKLSGVELLFLWKANSNGNKILWEKENLFVCLQHTHICPKHIYFFPFFIFMCSIEWDLHLCVCVCVWVCGGSVAVVPLLKCKFVLWT